MNINMLFNYFYRPFFLTAKRGMPLSPVSIASNIYVFNPRLAIVASGKNPVKIF